MTTVIWQTRDSGYGTDLGLCCAALAPGCVLDSRFLCDRRPQLRGCSRQTSTVASAFCGGCGAHAVLSVMLLLNWNFAAVVEGCVSFCVDMCTAVFRHQFCGDLHKGLI